MSQDVFQMRMDNITDSLPGITSIHDDTCIFGITQQEHDENLLDLPIKLHHNIQHVSFTTDRINITRGVTERDPYSTQSTTYHSMVGLIISMKSPA